MISSCYCCFQCLGEFRSLVQHPQFGETPHQVYQAISNLFLGQLLFGNISLSLYPALPLLSVPARVHLHIEPKHISTYCMIRVVEARLLGTGLHSERIVRFWGQKKLELARWILHKLLNTVNFQCSFNLFCFFSAFWLISELHGFILHILNSNFWQYFICLLGKLLWGFDDNSVCKHMRVNSMLHSTTNPIYNTLSMVCFKIIPFNVDWMIKFWEHEEGKLTTELWSTAIRPKFDSFNVIISLHRRQNKVA